MELRPEGHPDRAISLGNLASSLHTCFNQLGSLAKLDEAIALDHNALELHPEGHPHRAISLGNLTDSLHTHFNQLGSLADLGKAIALECNTLELHPEGHSDRAIALGNLANSLHTRFNQLRSLADLGKAIALEHNALELLPEGHPDRAHSLGSLANALYTRFSITHDICHLQEVPNLLSSLSDNSQVVSSATLNLCKHLIWAAEHCKHDSTVSVYRTFLHLVVQRLSILPSLPQHLVVLKQLTTSTAVDAFSACICHGNLLDVVELLERGCGVFWNQLTRLHTPLDDVIASGDTGKRLADRFTQLVILLCMVVDVSPDAKSQHDRACHLNTQLQGIVMEIHRLPGFSRFLQPPLFQSLQVVASSGPVIILNASQYTCDALIILSENHPIHVPLSITRTCVSELSTKLCGLTWCAKFGDVTKELLVFLQEIWDEVIFPIARTLQEFCPRGSRIWWCPTAEFSLLPLHATSSFRKGQPTFSDLYISSYTLTLIALVTRVNRLTSRSRILTLREVLTKRRCVLKARLGL